MQLLHMTIDELDGEESQLKFAIDKEEVATYYVDDGIHNPATIIYDFAKVSGSWKRKKPRYYLDGGMVRFILHTRSQSAALRVSCGRLRRF